MLRFKVMAILIIAVFSVQNNLVFADGQRTLSELAIAARDGDLERVKALIQSGAKVNDENKDETGDGNTFYYSNEIRALYLASMNGHLETVNLLLDRGAKANDNNKQGWISGLKTILPSLPNTLWDIYHPPSGPYNIRSVTPVEPEDVFIRIEKSINNDNLDELKSGYYNKSLEKSKALHVAAEKGHADLVQALIQGGAKVDEKREESYKAFYIQKPFNEIGSEIKKLEKEKIRFWSKSKDMYLVIGKKDEVDMEIIKKLELMGAGITDKRMNKRWGGWVRIKCNYLECKERGKTALMLAAYNGHPEVVRILIRAGADVDEKDSNGNTALMYAAEGGNSEIIKDLLDAGAKIDRSSARNLTALLHAAAFGNFETFETLAQAGADIENEYFNKRSVLFLAAELGCEKIVNYLCNLKCNVNARSKLGFTPLYVSSEKGHLDVVKKLISAGADPNIKSKSGHIAIHRAASGGHLNVVNELIATGSDVNLKTKNDFTPLYEASSKGHLDVVKALISAGADPNVPCKNEYLPIHIASYKGYIDIVEELIASGSKINAQPENEFTPLYYAAQEGYEEIVKALIEAGADINLKCGKKKKWRAVDVAKKNEHEKIVQTLKAAGAQD